MEEKTVVAPKKTLVWQVGGMLYGFGYLVRDRVELPNPAFPSDVVAALKKANAVKVILGEEEED